jgi:hypothetical protein
MSDLGKVRRGESLEVSALAWNRLVDTVVTKPRFVGDVEAYPRTNFTVRVRNSSATGVAKWGVLQIATVLEAPTGVTGGSTFESWPGLVGVVPTSTAGGSFVVAVEPIKAGEIGMAAVDGVVQVKLDVQDPTHRFATTKSGSSSSLRTDSNGESTILWKESGTGEGKWGLVRIGAGSGGGVKVGKITGTWTKGGTQTVWEYTGSGAQASGPSGPLSLTGVNRFANVTTTGGAAKWVAVASIDSTWHLIAAECS